MYNDMFAGNGFCTEAATFDLSTINVPVFAMFTDGDATCDNIDNLGLLYDDVTMLKQEATWTDGRGHASLSGSNDEVFFNSLAGQLQRSEVEPEGFETCLRDADYFTWSATEPMEY